MRFGQFSGVVSEEIRWQQKVSEPVQYTAGEGRNDFVLKRVAAVRWQHRGEEAERNPVEK